MSTSTRITDTDRGFRDVLARLGEKARVRVGVLTDAPKTGDDGEGGEATLLEIAGFHEFGAPGAKIPQRSFIRATVDEKAAEISAAIGAQARLVVLKRMPAATAIERVGALVKGLIQQRISAGIEPPNADSTIERKGSSKPLVDTGQLRSSIAYAVVKGGK